MDIIFLWLKSNLQYIISVMIPVILEVRPGASRCKMRFEIIVLHERVKEKSKRS